MSWRHRVRTSPWQPASRDVIFRAYSAEQAKKYEMILRHFGPLVLSHSTSIYAVTDDRVPLDQIGSGVYVETAKLRGIITARHVLYDQDLAPSEYVAFDKTVDFQLFRTGPPSDSELKSASETFFTLPKRTLRVAELGAPSPSFPDLAFIIFPPGTPSLRDKKYFKASEAGQVTTVIDELFEVSALSGTPSVHRDVRTSSQKPFSIGVRFPGYFGLGVHPLQMADDQDGNDLFYSEGNFESDPSITRKWNGMSGGGTWAGRYYFSGDSKEPMLQQLRLSGIMAEIHAKPGKSKYKIVCHGVRSIQSLLSRAESGNWHIWQPSP